MSSVTVTDSLSFGKTKDLDDICGKGDEVLWSGSATKVNCNNKRQLRDFVVTRRYILNLGKQEGFFSFFSSKLKRKIRIDLVKGVTYSIISNNFVLHIPEEYDYFLSCPESKSIIRAVLFALEQLNAPPIQMYLVEEIDLFKFTRYEGHKVSKTPSVVPQNINLRMFEDLVQTQVTETKRDVENTQTIITRDGNQVTEESFEIIKQIGKGHFGRVFLVEKKDNKELYALKVISKMDIIKRNFFENLQNEKRVMEKINSPFLVRMEYCFSSPKHVFFAMKFKQGGEIYHHLRKAARFPESTAKFYASQIITGLAQLHSLNIMYRDMKPENVLLDEKGNACLADFGISKILDPRETTKSFIGTPEYIAPEVILQKGYNKAVDIWCFGILLYEMVFGLPPFFNKNQNIMMNWIIKVDPSFPKMIPISLELQDLILKVILPVSGQRPIQTTWISGHK